MMSIGELRELGTLGTLGFIPGTQLPCRGRAMLRGCGISWVFSLIFLSFCTSSPLGKGVFSK